MNPVDSYKLVHGIGNEGLYFYSRIALKDDCLSRFVTSINPIAHDCDYQYNLNCVPRIFGLMELIYVTDGEMIISINGKTHYVGANNIILIPKYALVEMFENPDNPHTNYWFIFDVADDYSSFLLSKVVKEIIRPFPIDGFLLQIIKWCVNERNKKDDGNRVVIQSLFIFIITYTLRQLNIDIYAFEKHKTESIDETRLDYGKILSKSISLVHSQKGNIKVTDLCNNLFISPASLRRVFTHIFGLSPQGFIRIVRMYYAEIQLKDNSYSLTSIASGLGFSSVNHFSKEFKVFHGMCPREYRHDLESSEDLIKDNTK